MVNYIEGNVYMGSKDISSISNYQSLHLQPIRNLHVTVEVIDKDEKIIETIQGMATGGSISVSGNSLIRRTGSISFIMQDILLPNSKSMLWMTNKIRVFAGMEDLSSSDGTVTHFCLGTYYITEPQVSVSSDSSKVDITLEDNMMRWETTELESKLIFTADTPLNTAVESLMNAFGEWNTRIGFTDLKIPYEMEFNEGENIMSILTKLRDLYMDWECYYDIDGTFVFNKMEIQKEEGEPVVWRFENEANLITDFKSSFTYKQVKNRVVVIGQMDEVTGITPRAEAIIIPETSPFHESRVGTKTKVITDSSYGNAMQCDSRAKHELFKASTFQEKVSISTVPIYFLDANDIIEIVNPSTNVLERYVIDSISIGLGVEGDMGIECHKLYYNHFEIGGSLGDYQAGAELVINGIENLGWLSLAESRVAEFLGIEGDGSKLIVRFEYEGKHGVTAYVTGYVGESNQTLTIDLADFGEGTGESGDNGGSKAEYSDRVLGHEMVHAIMNNAYGVNKTIYMPEWFKEGVAELIHGADERLKTLISTSGKKDSALADKLVSRSIELLNGAVWRSESLDYGAGYLVMKYLMTKFSSGKTIKDFMWSLKQMNSSGSNVVKDAIVENTDFNTYNEFVANFSANASSFISFNLRLNYGVDEIDTGSIAGSDYGYAHLNAEKVFDNSKAERGLSAKGFKVEFNRP